MLEAPNESLSVREIESALSLLEICLEVPFVLDPLVLDALQVPVVSLSLDNLDVLIVKNTISLESVVTPLSLVGDLARRVVKNTPSHHIAFLPLSAVLTSLTVIKTSKAMLQPVDLVSLVAALTLFLDHVLSVSIFFGEGGRRW